MSTDLTSLDSTFDEAWPPDEWRDLHVVLAVSGGADSVAVLRLILAAKERAGGKGRLFVAHLNHGIRPVEAAADAAWVQDLCQRLALPCEIGIADVPNLADAQGDGLEAAARTARYNFLRESAERLGAASSPSPTRPTTRRKPCSSGCFAELAWPDWPACRASGRYHPPSS